MRDQACRHCRDGDGFDLPISFAFQPIIDSERREVFAYEALVRGPAGEGATTILDRLTDANRYAFDQRARSTAIALAAKLMPHCRARLSINIFPNAVYDPVRCLRVTLAAARRHNFPLDRLMFEATEHEEVKDLAHVRRLFEYYSSCGFTTAIDDFGAGYAGLAMLAEFTPQVLKLDRGLVRDIQNDPARQAIAAGVISTAERLGIRFIAEGVETVGELAFLRAMGVDLFQGYLFAKPGFEHLPKPDYAVLEASPPHNAPQARLAAIG